MPEIRLTDQLFVKAQLRANENGYESVEEYVADIIANDLESGVEDLEHLFTPARLAQIDKAAAQVDAGEFRTSKQVREYFTKRFEE